MLSRFGRARGLRGRSYVVGLCSASSASSQCSSLRRISNKSDEIGRQDSLLESSSLPKPRLDIRAIAENITYKSQNAFSRKSSLPVGAVQTIARLYEEHKSLQSDLNGKLFRRSLVSEQVRTNVGAEKTAAIEEARSLKSDINHMKERLDVIESEMTSLSLMVPNDTHPSTPVGPENAAIILSTHGPVPLPVSEHRDHVKLASALDMVDFKAAATATGSSWYYLTGAGALLENALTQYALQKAVARGYTPILTPDLIRHDIASRCGFQPRDQGDPPVQQMYHVQHASRTQPELVLSGTAEIPLGGMFATRTFASVQLPVKVVGLGRAFRCEAGARGADTRGLYRVHQFTKVELFAVTKQEDSETMMDEILELQLDLFNGLGLPLRVLDMPTEELGASAYRKFDIEAWMPGRGSWGEISSTSNCTDYQSRRLHVRYRQPASDVKHSSPSPPADKQERTPLAFAHTLNGTAAAIPRLIIAILENGVVLDERGNIVHVNLPKVLKPYWLGPDHLLDRLKWI